MSAGAVPASSGPDPAASYPVRLDGELDPAVSRGMWLIKWLLALPHMVILVFLWIAVFFVSVIAFFAILFTGRYPRGLFDFTAGVLRWSWRVGYYAYSVAGTDRYPPFSLAEDDAYPARFQVDYPQQLSRGLVLVKWWLLALPHYAIVGVLLGSSTAFYNHTANRTTVIRSPSLIGILVLIAVVALLFTGRYPDGLFRFVMGLQRWVFRVGAYALLLRDEYPPFRLDAGGTDPGSVAPPAPPGHDPAAAW